MQALWIWCKGKKRNFGLCLFALNTWANIQWAIPTHTQVLFLALLTAWGVVGVVDGAKK